MLLHVYRVSREAQGNLANAFLYAWTSMPLSGSLMKGKLFFQCESIPFGYRHRLGSNIAIMYKLDHKLPPSQSELYPFGIIKLHFWFFLLSREDNRKFV